MFAEDVDFSVIQHLLRTRMLSVAFIKVSNSPLKLMFLAEFHGLGTIRGRRVAEVRRGGLKSAIPGIRARLSTCQCSPTPL